MKKEQKNRFTFLETGYCSFPLKDYKKEFSVLDTFDLNISKKKIKQVKSLTEDIFLSNHIIHREIEREVWKEIKKNKTITQEADWVVISYIQEFADEIIVSLDLLKEE